MKAVKKRFAALAVGAALVLGMLCGFAVPHVYAIEERRAQIIVNPPTVYTQSHYAAVEFGWDGDYNDKLIVGNNINPSYGSVDIGSDQYREIRVNAHTMEYFWAQAYYEEANGRKHMSNRTMHTASCYPINSLCDYIEPGTKTSVTEDYSFFGSIPENSEGTVYISIGVEGICYNYFAQYPGSGGSTVLNRTPGDIGFNIVIKQTEITVTTSTPVTYGTTSNAFNNRVVFGFTLVLN